MALVGLTRLLQGTHNDILNKESRLGSQVFYYFVCSSSVMDAVGLFCISSAPALSASKWRLSYRRGVWGWRGLVGGDWGGGL